jgi:hypothetical protein
VEIGAANIVVCGPACEAEARARILLRIHGSLLAALRRALRDWQSGRGKAGVILALLDRELAQTTARDAMLGLTREAVGTARDRRDTMLENALIARIRELSRPQPPPNTSRS